MPRACGRRSCLATCLVDVGMPQVPLLSQHGQMALEATKTLPRALALFSNKRRNQCANKGRADGESAH